MKDQRTAMGMPVIIDIVDQNSTLKDIDDLFEYFEYIEQIFSPFRENSETCRINRDEISPNDYSPEMKEILLLAEQTKKDTDGFFNIETFPGKINPVGIVKGWAIYNAAKILEKKGFKNFYVDIGGDIQTKGLNQEGKKWKIGIRNPFSDTPGQELIKIVYLSGEGIATSGNYLRGEHIYNPFNPKEKLEDLVSFSIIGPNIYEADRFATAVFAMGKEGINFIENISGFEGYMVTRDKRATMTSGFEIYTK